MIIQKYNPKKFILLSIFAMLIIGTIIILYFLFLKNTRLTEENSYLNREITRFSFENKNLEKHNAELSGLLNNYEDLKPVDAEKLKSKIYNSLQNKFKINDYTEKLNPTEGYIVLSSIFSNSKKSVVYLERSLSNYDYNIVVIDLATREKNTIYSYKSGINPSSGACPFEYFPVAWSKNDKKIIVEWVNTTGSGSGCVFQYASYTIDITGGDLINLATEEAIFLDDNLEVVYVDRSNKSPNFCGPGGTENNGSIKLKNIETGEEKIIIEEENSYYSIVEINNNNLTYKIKKIPQETNGCSELDESFPESEKEIKIN